MREEDEPTDVGSDGLSSFMEEIAEPLLCNARLLLGILLIAFAIRMTYAVVDQVPLRVDARLYHGVALNLMNGFGFVESPGVPAHQDPVIRLSSPLYPMFLSGIYAIFGVRLWVVWLIQALMGALTCIALFMAGRQAFGDQVGLLAAFVAAVNFDLIIYPAMLLTETLYLFLVSLGLVVLFLAISARSPRIYFLAGIVLGLATFTRPNLAFFLVLFCLWKARYEMVRAVIPLMLGVALILMPWAIRNYQIYHEFFLLPANGGIAFWLGNNPEADGSYPNQVPAFIREKSIRPAYMREQNRQGYAEGYRFIREHPVRYVRLLGLKLTKFLSPLRTNGWWFHMQGVERVVSILLSGLTTAFLLAFGLLGMFLAAKRRPNAQITCGLLYALSVLSSAFIYMTHARYRLPIFPVLIIFAAYGAVEVWRNQAFPETDGDRRMVRRALIGAMGIVLAAVTIDGLTTASEILRRVSRLFGT